MGQRLSHAFNGKCIIWWQHESHSRFIWRLKELQWKRATIVLSAEQNFKFECYKRLLPGSGQPAHTMQFFSKFHWSKILLLVLCRQQLLAKESCLPSKQWKKVFNLFYMNLPKIASFKVKLHNFKSNRVICIH